MGLREMLIKSVSGVRALVKELAQRPEYLLILLFLLCFFRFKIAADGEGYYQILKCIFVYHILPPSDNPYQFGVTIFWYPFYLLFREKGLNIGSFIYGLAALVLCFKAFKKVGFLEADVNRSIILSAIGTPILAFYGLWSYYNHTVDAFAIALSVYLLVKFESGIRFNESILLGVAVGSATLVRYVNFLLFPLIALYIFKINRRSTLPFSTSFLAVASTILLYNFHVHGNPFETGQPNILAYYPNVLGQWLSQTHGIFVWTPLCLFSLLGLAFGALKGKGVEKHLCLTGLTLFLSFSFFYSACGDFPPYDRVGGSFSDRFFAGLLTFFTLGVIELTRLHERLKLLAYAAAAFTVFIFISYVGIFYFYTIQYVHFDLNWWGGTYAPPLLELLGLLNLNLLTLFLTPCLILFLSLYILIELI